MIEITRDDREVLATAPVGRLALARIKDLESELATEKALVCLLRERNELLQQTAQALALRVVQSEHEARSAGFPGPVGCSGEPGDG